MRVEFITIEEATETIIDYRGKTPPKTESGIRLITAKVIKKGRILDTRSEYIAEDYYDSWMRRGLPKQWDILLTTEAPLGEVAILKTPEKVALAQRVILLRGNPEKVNQRYFFHALKSPIVQEGLLRRATGTTVLGIKQSELLNVEIPIFSLLTQHKIAAILSTYDELIENNTRRITILEEMAQRLYREWFVHFRYPGHENDRLVESELGLIPEEWGVRKLGDVIELAYGKGLKQDARIPGSFPVFGSGGIIGMHDKSLVNGPGIIVGRKGNVGSVYWSDENFFPIDTVFYVVTDLPLYYVFYNLQYQDFQNTDAAVPGLSRNMAYLNDIVIPASSILEEFSRHIIPIFKQHFLLRQSIENLMKTRDLLLPKLISGKIDVSELDIKTGGNEKPEKVMDNA